MVKVAIIIVNWNQPELTITTVESFLQLKKDINIIYHLFIIDNHSTDNSYQKLTKKFQNNSLITIQQLNNNLGYSGGNNYGIKNALLENFDYILCANNDIIVNPNFLNILVKDLEKHPKVAINAPKIYFAPHHEYHAARYQPSDLGKVIWSAGGKIDWNNIYGSNYGIDEVDKGQYNQENTNLDFLSGCCFLIRSSVLIKHGSFDHNYFMYLEDVDLCQRYLKAGYQIKYVPKAYIWHINSGSSSPSSVLHQYFLTRNRLIFGHKYAKFRTRLALLKESIIKLFTSNLYWEKRAIYDYFIHKWGVGSWH